MKTTTTYTTTAFYNSPTSKQKQSNNISAFTHPQEMIRRLIPYAKGKENTRPDKSLDKINFSQGVQKDELVLHINSLQTEIDNIHAQIVQSENLLHVRDNLYGQLDLLRDQREQIENDISCVESQRQTVQIRVKSGYKQMNQRLRRRINQIREYIHKMELENRKIQQTINVSSSMAKQAHYRTQLSSTAHLDNAYLHDRSRASQKIDDLIHRLHQKQDQAVQNARRQQQQIQRRNMASRHLIQGSRTMQHIQSSKNLMQSKSTRNIEASTYDRRKFYSPSYRY